MGIYKEILAEQLNAAIRDVGRGGDPFEIAVLAGLLGDDAPSSVRPLREQIKIDAQEMMNGLIEKIISVNECDTCDEIINLLMDIEETCAGLHWLGYEKICDDELDLMALTIRAFPSLWKSAAKFASRSIAGARQNDLMLKIWRAVEATQFE